MSIVKKLHTAFNCGYQMGHHDTVESQFNDTDDSADEFIEEYKSGDIDTGCCWNTVDAGETYFETDCRKSFTLNEGTPKENGFLFCPFCGEVLIETA